MNKLIFVLCLFLSFFIYGCAKITIIPAQPSYETVSEPALNVEITKSIGEELLVQSKTARTKVIKILKKTAMDTVFAGEYILQGFFITANNGSNTTANNFKGDGKLFRVDIYEPVRETGAFIKEVAPFMTKVYTRLFFNTASNSLCRGMTDWISTYTCHHIIPSSDFESKEITLDKDENFQQTLVYTGKQGDIVNFLYREYSNSMIRSAYSVEVTYDLKDGDEIAFKNAALKITKVTNSSITYIVLKNFK